MNGVPQIQINAVRPTSPPKILSAGRAPSPRIVNTKFNHNKPPVHVSSIQSLPATKDITVPRV